MPARKRRLTATPGVSHTSRRPIGFPILEGYLYAIGATTNSYTEIKTDSPREYTVDSIDRLLFQFRRNPGIWILSISILLLIVIGVSAYNITKNIRKDRLLQAQQYLKEEKADDLLQLVSNADPNKKDAEFQEYFAKATDLKKKQTAIKTCSFGAGTVKQLFNDKKMKEVGSILAACKEAKTYSGVSLLVDPSQVVLETKLDLLRTTFEVGKALSEAAIRQFLSDYFPDVPPHQGDSLEVALDRKKVLVTFHQERKATAGSAPDLVLVTAFQVLLPPSPPPSPARVEQPLPNDSPIDCADFARYVTAKGHDFWEKAILVKTAEQNGKCRW